MTTFTASMKRAISPPEAILSSGPGSEPGLVADEEADAVGAGGTPFALRQPGDRVTKRALSSFSGGSSFATNRSSFSAAFTALALSFFGGGQICGTAAADFRLQPVQYFLLPFGQGQARGQCVADARQVVSRGNYVCAPARAGHAGGRRFQAGCIRCLPVRWDRACTCAVTSRISAVARSRPSRSFGASSPCAPMRARRNRAPPPPPPGLHAPWQDFPASCVRRIRRVRKAASFSSSPALGSSSSRSSTAPRR